MNHKIYYEFYKLELLRKIFFYNKTSKLNIFVLPHNNTFYLDYLMKDAKDKFEYYWIHSSFKHKNIRDNLKYLCNDYLKLDMPIINNKINLNDINRYYKKAFYDNINFNKNIFFYFELLNIKEHELNDISKELGEKVIFNISLYKEDIDINKLKQNKLIELYDFENDKILKYLSDYHINKDKIEF